MSQDSPQGSTLPLKNSKHELFAQYIADGKSEKDAYQSVYGCKPSTARIESVKLYAKPLVRARVGFLKEQNAKVAALSREQKRLILAEIALNAKDDRVRIQAIQEDNRMTGDVDEASKQCHVFNFNIPRAQ